MVFDLPLLGSPKLRGTSIPVPATFQTQLSISQSFFPLSKVPSPHLQGQPGLGSSSDSGSFSWCSVALI